jgi:hypothetical protein
MHNLKQRYSLRDPSVDEIIVLTRKLKKISGFIWLRVGGLVAVPSENCRLCERTSGSIKVWEFLEWLSV